MSTLKITIPWTPKAKASVRVGKNGMYNPSCKGMLETRTHVTQQMQDQGLMLLKGPLLVIVHFEINAPLVYRGDKRKSLHTCPHTLRPDGDNLEKYLNDALNGIVWRDDSQIAWLVRSKSITAERKGQTVLYVRELDEGKPNYDKIISDIIDHIKLEEQHATSKPSTRAILPPHNGKLSAG
jgi:Holliday junction resolvase RusA-like endonuclease